MQDLEILKINEMAEKIPNCIRFDKGSAKFPFPEEFIPFVEKIKKEVRGKYFHYPRKGGEEKLKEQIVQLELKNNRQLSSKDVAVTHGGMSGLFNAFNLLVKPGNEVITNNYCFEGFSALIERFKAEHIRVNLSKAKELEKAISAKSKIIILNSPENPTGKIYSQEEINNIIELAEKRNLWLLSDEVLNQFVYNGNIWQGPSLKNERVIIINSFSKSYFIPGIRVGWIAAKNGRFIKEFNNSIEAQSVGVNLLSQLLMAEIIENVNYEKFLEKRLDVLSKRKNLFEKLLKKNNIVYLHKIEGGMNFYVDLKQDTQKFASKLLPEFSVAIIPGYAFEGKPSTFARLGFGAVSEEEISRGIEAIQRAR